MRNTKKMVVLVREEEGSTDDASRVLKWVYKGGFSLSRYFEPQSCLIQKKDRLSFNLMLLPFFCM